MIENSQRLYRNTALPPKPSAFLTDKQIVPAKHRVKKINHKESSWSTETNLSLKSGKALGKKLTQLLTSFVRSFTGLVTITSTEYDCRPKTKSFDPNSFPETLAKVPQAEPRELENPVAATVIFMLVHTKIKIVSMLLPK